MTVQLSTNPSRRRRDGRLHPSAGVLLMRHRHGPGGPVARCPQPGGKRPASMTCWGRSRWPQGWRSSRGGFSPSLVALAVAVLARCGRRRAADRAGRFSPAFMRRLAVAALSAQLLAAPVGPGGCTACRAGLGPDPGSGGPGPNGPPPARHSRPRRTTACPSELQSTPAAPEPHVPCRRQSGPTGGPAHRSPIPACWRPNPSAPPRASPPGRA